MFEEKPRFHYKYKFYICICIPLLEILGFRVADVTETIEYFQPLWLDVCDNNGDIKTVIQKYDELGFEATCDVPTNAYWKELYQNIYNCKIILTVRDNPDVWVKSFKTYFAACADYGPSIFFRLGYLGMLGSSIGSNMKLSLYFPRFLLLF